MDKSLAGENTANLTAIRNRPRYFLGLRLVQINTSDKMKDVQINQNLRRIYYVILNTYITKILNWLGWGTMFGRTLRGKAHFQSWDATFQFFLTGLIISSTINILQDKSHKITPDFRSTQFAAI